MIELFWLLLPVAAASGWWAAKRSNRKKRGKGADNLPVSSDYYRGLNFLLNEEQDKALEVFMRMVEVDSETVETHLALAGLFRRRGEVERAIRVHQNLLARPTLDQEQRTLALLELAKDYMHAGLLDRAESLFHELVRQRSQLNEAFSYLLDIYQSENEWEKAIDVARQLAALAGRNVKPVIAHCYCEIALRQKKNGYIDKAITSLKRALAADNRSVRANILLGHLHYLEDRYRSAYRYYLRIFELDEEFIPEILDCLISCIERGVPAQEFENYVRLLSSGQKHNMLIPGLARYLYITQGAGAARDYINDQLQKTPTLRGLKEWVELEKLERRDQDFQLRVVIDALQAVLKQLPGYQCRQCGYTSTVLNWQCPSCRAWTSIKPTARILNH